MLQREGACTSLAGRWHAPDWEKANGDTPFVDVNQYSLGSSNVVTLRSHSVMIQSFRSGVTW
jgi:hypothetical protein